ncbi:MAG: hypothetical protein SNJ79_04105 [Sphingomonadaceae bacterium]
MILLSLANSAVGMLNSSAFLLLAAGPALATYILCSSIHATTSWLYSWMAPAAVGYRIESIALARALQLIPLIAGVSILLTVAPSMMGLIFSLVLFIECFFSPSFLLLFYSNTKRYLLIEVGRNITNSVLLILNILFAGGRPELHAAAGALIATGIGVFLYLAGWLRPVPLRWPARGQLIAAVRRAASIPQVKLLISARGLEVVSLVLLNALQQLPAMLSLKLGLALNSSLALNARRYGLPVLLPLQLAVYAGLVGAAVWLGQSGLPLVPQTLSLIRPEYALLTGPVVALIFVLLVTGLRAGGLPTPAARAQDAGQQGGRA